eukprot:741583-Prymnesium_polylepis.1
MLNSVANESEQRAAALHLSHGWTEQKHTQARSPWSRDVVEERLSSHVIRRVTHTHRARCCLSRARLVL